MFTSSHYQLIAQLILKLEEGSAICSWGSRCNGDLVGKNLNEGFSYWLMCAGIAYMDLQRYFCNDKQPQWLSLEKLLQEAAVRKHQHTNDHEDTGLRDLGHVGARYDLLSWPAIHHFRWLLFRTRCCSLSQGRPRALAPNYCPTG